MSQTHRLDSSFRTIFYVPERDGLSKQEWGNPLKDQFVGEQRQNPRPTAVVALSEMDLRDTLNYKDTISEEFPVIYSLESYEQDVIVRFVAPSL